MHVALTAAYSHIFNSFRQPAPPPPTHGIMQMTAHNVPVLSWLTVDSTRMTYPHVYSEVGEQTFLKSPQVANPHILSLIPLSQIRKLLRCAIPQIKNSQIFFINPQISNSQISRKYCHIAKGLQI
jgi:hypothetical protein